MLFFFCIFIFQDFKLHTLVYLMSEIEHVFLYISVVFTFLVVRSRGVFFFHMIIYRFSWFYIVCVAVIVFVFLKVSLQHFLFGGWVYLIISFGIFLLVSFSVVFCLSFIKQLSNLFCCLIQPNSFFLRLIRFWLFPFYYTLADFLFNWSMLILFLQVFPTFYSFCWIQR